ncbi:sulfotransferase [Paenibacillus sacheonensis]|uniref:Sulfotransferase n=1 Tax=Paenibacillus sacheonensis TaxID=742054 RepID=A0A7X5C1Y6_9BACL|nr:sulfotransferase [Paenibacillus sacheonensis]MBM7567327.1 hypothetical protein [Paenibacillus sacheonensis]NBC69889.1 sulfotransferase [Paenibacillus sacheonensis]
MIQANGENLIFLLSTPRSGSSLATIMLQKHSKIFASQEMWFLMSLYDLRLKKEPPYGGSSIIHQFFNGIVPEDTYRNACRAFALQVYNGLLHSSSGAELLLDKSPRYYYILEFLDSLFPQSKRIWLKRNPLAVAASYKKLNAERFGGRFNLKDAFLQPAFNNKVNDLTVGLFRYYDYFAHPHPNTHHLSYETMVARPQEELTHLCRFLGISYEQGLESYGDVKGTDKGKLYFSMGVGDPNVADHNQPHLDSIASWRETLSKEEMAVYCRSIGAKLFRDMGYADELEEAERMTGLRFDDEPDQEMMLYRTSQIKDIAGMKWTNHYHIRSNESLSDSPQEDTTKPVTSVQSEVLQLQMTLQAVEQRLEKSYQRHEQAAKELQQLRRKVRRVKSMIPFGDKLSHLVTNYFRRREQI